MRADLVRVGNSRGIRIPKAIIEQCGLGGTVQLSVENGRVVISPERTVRQGWEESFRAEGATRPDENLLAGIPPNRFDDDEWTW